MPCYREKIESLEAELAGLKDVLKAAERLINSLGEDLQADCAVSDETIKAYTFALSAYRACEREGKE